MKGSRIAAAIVIAAWGVLLGPTVLAADAKAPAGAAKADAKPGERQAGIEAAERALERSLVLTGGLLLPAGAAEFEPGFVYLRHEVEAPIFFEEGGQQFIASESARTATVEANMLLRIGLPRDMQLELGLPYRYVEESRTIAVGGEIRAADGAHNSGTGDLRIGLAKTLYRARGAQSSLVGRVTWDTGTGDDDVDPVSLGRFGSDELDVSLSATNRQDPLVFVGNVYYRRVLDDEDFTPGDQFGFSLGALLAASPDTSLRVVLDQTYEEKFALNGVTVPGSDAVITGLLFGASSNLDAGRFLDVWVQAGLTDDAPAYTFGIAYAMRFNTPWFR